MCVILFNRSAADSGLSRCDRLNCDNLDFVTLVSRYKSVQPSWILLRQQMMVAAALSTGTQSSNHINTASAWIFPSFWPNQQRQSTGGKGKVDHAPQESVGTCVHLRLLCLERSPSVENH